MSRAAPPYAPGPYQQIGPDGQEYFKVLPEVRGLVQLWVDGTATVNQLRALRNRHPAAGPKAALLARALTDLEVQIKAGEIVIAQATDNAVRDRIRATAVRQGTSDRMYKAIESRPIRPGGSPLPLFAVGQVDISILAKATLRRGARKPYWGAQEFGYTGNIGRRVRGLFFPGGVAPDPSQFRVHPVFSRTTSTRVSAVMHIQRPIEERAFLRSGVMSAALLRQRLWRQIERDALAELQRALRLRAPTTRRRRP